MRYVRTKDGIFKLADYLGIHSGKKYALMDDAKGNRITMCQEPEELYKTADTIEELGDVYVIEKFKHIFTIDKFSKELVRYYKGSGEIYCAIWTDKGLIYVAKMNDEGELELL